MSQSALHLLPDGRRVAFRQLNGSGPAVVFLPGYMSDMTGSKAIALFGWASLTGRACLLLDYSGCGESPGDFAEGTLSRWCEEVVTLVEARLDGPLVLVGSSMGGWLMLLAARRLGARVAALVGVAAAPDFTDWGYDAAQKAPGGIDGRILYRCACCPANARKNCTTVSAAMISSPRHGR